MSPGCRNASATEYAVDSGTIARREQGRAEEAEAEQRRREVPGERLERPAASLASLIVTPVDVQGRGAGDDDEHADDAVSTAPTITSMRS